MWRRVIRWQFSDILKRNLLLIFYDTRKTTYTFTWLPWFPFSEIKTFNKICPMFNRTPWIKKNYLDREFKTSGSKFCTFRGTDYSMCEQTTYTAIFLLWRCNPTRVMASSFLRFLDHTKRRTTVGRTPLDEWSARRRDLYLKTHHIHNRQTSIPPVGFEPTISAGERPQTYSLDRAATGTGIVNCYFLFFVL
jgi:hypothetical protein